MLLKIDVCEHVEDGYVPANLLVHDKEWRVGAGGWYFPWHEKLACPYCDHACSVTEVGTCETCEQWNAPDGSSNDFGPAGGFCLVDERGRDADEYCSDWEAKAAAQIRGAE